MRNLLRVLPVLVMTGLGSYAIGTGRTIAQAATPKVNACGCYRDTAGGCLCGKKGKCDCPGDCEPRGCEEKRSKEIDKEVEAETKRAREMEKKQRDQETEKERKAAAARDEEGSTESSGDSSDVPAGESSAVQGQDDTGDKKAKKGKSGKSSKSGKGEKTGKTGRSTKSSDE